MYIRWVGSSGVKKLQGNAIVIQRFITIEIEYLPVGRLLVFHFVSKLRFNQIIINFGTVCSGFCC